MGAPVGLRQRYPSLPRRVCDRRRAEPHLGVKRSSEGASIALRKPPDLFSFTVGDVTIQTTGGAVLSGVNLLPHLLLIRLLSTQPPHRAFCQALVQSMTGELRVADCLQEQQR